MALRNSMNNRWKIIITIIIIIDIAIPNMENINTGYSKKIHKCEQLSIEM